MILTVDRALLWCSQAMLGWLYQGRLSWDVRFGGATEKDTHSLWKTSIGENIKGDGLMSPFGSDLQRYVKLSLFEYDIACFRVC